MSGKAEEQGNEDMTDFLYKDRYESDWGLIGKHLFDRLKKNLRGFSWVMPSLLKSNVSSKVHTRVLVHLRPRR